MTKSTAKQLVLDYLITTLEYQIYNLSEDLSEDLDGNKRSEKDLAKIFEAIEILKNEFIGRTKGLK